eukprot:2658944-Pleurochrysis_carterae.AAC.1
MGEGRWWKDPGTGARRVKGQGEIYENEAGRLSACECNCTRACACSSLMVRAPKLMRSVAVAPTSVSRICYA